MHILKTHISTQNYLKCRWKPKTMYTTWLCLCVDWSKQIIFLYVPLLVTAESWSEWSDWSMCDTSGIQIRARHCILLFPVGSQCSGNTTESRPCVFDSNFIPGNGRDVHQYEQNHSNIKEKMIHRPSFLTVLSGCVWWNRTESINFWGFTVTKYSL